MAVAAGLFLQAGHLWPASSHLTSLQASQASRQHDVHSKHVTSKHHSRQHDVDDKQGELRRLKNRVSMWGSLVVVAL